MIKRTDILLIVVFVLSASCATGGGLTRKDALSFYEPVRTLDAEIRAAIDNNADVLAPTALDEATEHLEESLECGMDGDKEDAEAEATTGLEMMKTVRADMDNARTILQEVLKARSDAIDESADEMYAEKFDELDETFKEASIYVKKGKLADAREMKPQLVHEYSELELKALKTGTVEAAKAAIASAKKANAEEYAPKTLELARKEIKLVTAVLETDRTQTEKANYHARRTIWMANRAAAIAKTSRDFEKKDLTMEEIILWYQDQLATVNEPFGGELPFDKPNKELVVVFKETVESVVRGLNESLVMNNDLQATIARRGEEHRQKEADADRIITSLLNANRKELIALKKKYAHKLTKEGKKGARADEKELVLKQHYQAIAASFGPSEATVTLEGSDIQVAAHGFYFSSGGTDIEARNFGLLNKVASALARFPSARIIISGHTDSKGNNKRNLRISKERAEHVAQFFHEVGKIDKSRIEYNGYGETKPVTTNETKEGRALNRRIEFLIATNLQ